MTVGKIWRHMLGTVEDLFIAIKHNLEKSSSCDGCGKHTHTHTHYTFHLTLPVKE